MSRRDMTKEEQDKRDVLDAKLEALQEESRKLFHQICDLRRCHDCWAKEGELHTPGCDMERCPFCGGQLISCECRYKHLYADCFKPQTWNYQLHKFEGHPTNGLPEEVYDNGLPPEVLKVWEQMLEQKGRVPYIIYPNICVKCGIHYPEMFRVKDEEWIETVQVEYRDEMLCRPCYDRIRKVTGKGRKK